MNKLLIADDESRIREVIKEYAQFFDFEVYQAVDGEDAVTKALSENFDIIVMDISFISIKKVLYKIKELLKDNGFAIFLIKPQFEAERNEINKGIVDSLNVHKRVINEVIEEAKINQLFLENLTVSPIRGTKGNIEYLAKFSNKNNFSSTEEIVNRLFNN